MKLVQLLLRDFAGGAIPKGLRRLGAPDFSMLGGNEFRLRQGFAEQSACTRPERGVPEARR